MMILAEDMTKCEIGGHLGRHLEFLKRASVDFWGLLVCCRGSFSKHFLTFSACYEFVRVFTHIDPNTLVLGVVMYVGVRLI